MCWMIVTASWPIWAKVVAWLLPVAIGFVLIWWLER